MNCLYFYVFNGNLDFFFFELSFPVLSPKPNYLKGCPPSLHVISCSLGCPHTAPDKLTSYFLNAQTCQLSSRHSWAFRSPHQPSHILLLCCCLWRSLCRRVCPYPLLPTVCLITSHSWRFSWNITIPSGQAAFPGSLQPPASPQCKLHLIHFCVHLSY